MIRTFHFLLILFCCLSTIAQAQYTALEKDSTAKASGVHKGRLTTVIATETAIYGGALAVLWGFWYSDNDHSAFHFHNDNAGWNQIDKFGHMYSSYVQSYWGLKALRWAGVKDKKAIFLGGGLGIIMQTPIEILDGLSENWGASPGDLIANTAGSALVIGQELLWQEQRIKMKFSFFPSQYIEYRPSYFGTTLGENLIRDYNSHTYWYSLNLSSFAKNKKLPKWLNVAVGYGAGGMLSEFYNPEYSVKDGPLPALERYRQFYLSFDADLTRVPIKSKFLKNIFEVINIIKIPAPALEFNTSHGWKVHALHF